MSNDNKGAFVISLGNRVLLEWGRLAPKSSVITSREPFGDNTFSASLSVRRLLMAVKNALLLGGVASSAIEDEEIFLGLRLWIKCIKEWRESIPVEDAGSAVGGLFSSHPVDL